MQKNRTLATEILIEEKRRTAFWFIAFVVTFTTVMVKEVYRAWKKKIS